MRRLLRLPLRTRVLLALLLTALLFVCARSAAAQQAVRPPAPPIAQRAAPDSADPRAYLALSRQHRERGNPQEAERVLREGITRVTDARLIRWELAAMLSDAGRFTDAVAVLEPIAAADTAARKAIAQMRVNIGTEAFNAGRKAEARRVWEQALRDDPALLEASLRLGVVLLELEQKDSARVVASRALKRAPRDPRLLSLHAATLDGPEALPAAIRAHRALRAQRPNDETIAVQLAQMLASGRDAAGAKALYDTLLARPKPGLAVVRGAAELALATGRIEEGALLLKDAVVRFPEDGTLWQLRGDAARALKNWKIAIESYTNAIAKQADPASAELALVEVHADSGDTTAALAVLHGVASRGAPRPVLLRAAGRAAELRPTHGDSLYGVLLARDSTDVDALERSGELAEAAGDTARAISLYRRAVDTDRSGPTAPYGLYRLARGPADSARVMLRRALWRGMETVRTVEMQALASLENGSSGAGEQNALHARLVRTVRAVLDETILGTEWGPAELASLRIAYTSSSLLERYHALLLRRNGRHAEALAVYDRILRGHAADAELLRMRADVLVALGRTNDAREAYRRALDVDPEDEASFRALLALADNSLGAREELLAQVRRLRVRKPASVTLVEREIELLHRLGRLDEAVKASTERDELLKRKKGAGGTS